MNELVAGDLEKQTPTPDLRVDDHGKARIVFPDDGIFVAKALFRWGSFTRTRIPGTTGSDSDPSLALDDAGRAHVVFRRNPAGSSNDGTVYAHETGGGWTSDRFTSRLGELAISLDASDDPHLVVALGSGSGGVFSYDGPSLTEDQVAAARVADVAFRVPSVGAPVVLFSQRTSPRGIGVSRD